MKLEDAQLYEVKLDCIDKCHQLILENPMAKTYGHISRTDQKSLKLKIEKIWRRQKRKTVEQLLKSLDYANMTTTEGSTFQEKLQNHSIRGQSFGTELQLFL